MKERRKLKNFIFPIFHRELNRREKEPRRQQQPSQSAKEQVSSFLCVDSHSWKWCILKVSQMRTRRYLSSARLIFMLFYPPASSHQDIMTMKTKDYRVNPLKSFIRWWMMNGRREKVGSWISQADSVTWNPTQPLKSLLYFSDAFIP